MALHDLTPQLRTRLSRMERLVGWFVFLATLVLVSGFVYYAYHMAKRKGWFIPKASYFTFTDRATGLKVGDPVKLMGFDVGQITSIDSMPPWKPYNVYIEFEIKERYNGYLWSGDHGSRAKVVTADFLGNRVLEVTKGYDGYPIYGFNPLRELTLPEAESMREAELTNLVLAAEIYDASGTNLVLGALKPLIKTNLIKLAALGVKKFAVLDTREQRKAPTVVWSDKEGAYGPFWKTNIYWLLADESPAVTERLEKLVAQVEKAIPSFISLTNQLITVLSNTASLTSNLNLVALSAGPVMSNAAVLTADLRGPGALGQWLLPTNMQAQVQEALTNLNSAMVAGRAALTNADAGLASVIQRLNESLENVAGITSNLNAQVQANTNILTSISDAVVHADDLVQGLKRHWLLRSAFKPQPAPKTNTPPAKLRSPKDLSQ